MGEAASAPIALTRYNGYPSVQVNGAPAMGRSSGEALATMERLSATVLPEGVGYLWSGQSLQEKLAGIDGNRITFLQQTNRAAHGGLG